MTVNIIQTNKTNLKTMETYTVHAIEAIVEKVIAACETGTSVKSVEQFKDCFTVKLKGDVFLSTLNVLARTIGDEQMIIGSEDNETTLFLKPQL